MQEEYALKSKEVVNIIAIGDFHIGSKQFNKDFFKQMLKQIRDLPRRRIYLMGDCIEVATKSVGDSAFQTECTVDEQREYFINNIKPFKDDIVGYCMGNHEYRLNKEYGYNIVKDMCRELGINHYNQSIDTFRVNDFDFSVYTRHGKGSSQRRHLGYPLCFFNFAAAMALGSFSGLERLIVISISPYLLPVTHFTSFLIL